MEHTLFTTLPLQEQREALLHQGIFLAERIEGEYLIVLYSLGDFYVESYFNFDHFELEQFKTFDALDLLEPYLRRINIDELRMLL